MPVKRVRARREQHGAIEIGFDDALALSAVAAPQLQFAAILAAPVRRQIDQQVQAPVRLQLLVPVEVGVDAEMSAVPAQVNSAAGQMRVGQKVFDPGELFEKADER